MSDTDVSSERPAKRQRLSPSGSNEDKTASVTTATSEPNKTCDFSIDTKELEVGISEFVSQDVIPFQAQLKTRYTDFMVNEILQDGHVVRLTDMSVPKKLLSSGSGKRKHGKKSEQGPIASDLSNVQQGTGEVSKATEEPPAADASNPPPPVASSTISDSDRQQMVSYLNEEAVAELLELYKSIIAHPSWKSKDHPLVRTEFTDDRSLRGEIHQAIRRIFNMKIDSSTDKEGILSLTAANQSTRKAPTNNNNEDDKPSYYPGKLGWLERGGEYVHFTLYKENKDTMEAIGFLVRQMKINTKAFQFAGTKDRRAVTAQRCSAYRLDAERLVKQNYHLRNAAVGNFEYKPSGLELGDLGGNEFVITLRECVFSGLPNTTTDESLEKVRSALDLALRNLHSKGYLNYFGLQRFGTFATRTDTVGVRILRGDFRSACEAILHYSPEALAAADHEAEGEGSAPHATAPLSGPSRDEVARAKSIHLYEKSSNAHKALEILPRKFTAENQVMRHLARTPSDYIGALLVIPRNLRLMYVHAYQSLIWNKAVTKRWQLYGSTVVEGDLVLIKEHQGKEATTAEADASNGIDADGEIIIAPSSHDRSNQLDDIFDRARALTATEAASGDYSIFDVVLPLPGYDVLYPANATGQFYKDFMGSEEGGNIDPHDMRRKQKDFSLSGGYRKVLARIGKECSVRVERYTRDDEQFVQTDLEKIQAAKRQADAEKAATAENTDKVRNGEAGEVENPTEGATGADTKSGGNAQGKDKIAAILKFQLGSSQYATMVLRELSRGGISSYKAEFGGGK